MTGRMQNTGHRESAYLRPSQTWQCALAESCHAGPTAAGQCPRSESPCSPKRSIKASRKRFSILLLSTAFACFVLLLGSKVLLPKLSPGPLSVSHAEVTSCVDCHAAIEESMSDWVHKAIGLNSNNDDQKCLSCHKLGANAFSPHSTAAINLSSSLRGLAENDAGSKPSTVELDDWKIRLANNINTWQNTPEKEVSCSSCHREHKGKFAPLDGFNPQQCHSCHQVTFNEMETGHPEYSQFPHNRATRINFDHVAHLEKHFLEDDVFDIAPDGCKQCHDTDQSGEWMLSNTFETTCSSCHLDEIFGDSRASAKGVAVLSVPELDVASLNSNGYNVGQWPKWADGELTPIMQALLAPQGGVETSAPASMFDLSDSNQQELKASATLAWQIKELFYDIQMGGAKVLGERIMASFGGDLDQSTLNRLVASLPRDTLVNNQQEWFPDLLQEVRDYREGALTLYSVTEPSSSRFNDNNHSEVVENINIDVNEDDILLNEDILENDILTDDEALLDDDFLTDDDDPELLEDDQELSNILSGDSEILSDDDLLLEDDDDVNRSPIETTELDVTEADNETWALSGGWYRDGSSILYRPVDHADQFFKTWLEVSSRDNGQASSKIFTSLTQDESVGACVKCHSASGIKSGTQLGNQLAQKIHWNSFKPQDIKVDFNRFSHVSHFSLMNDDGCSSCHSLNESELEKKTSSGEVFTPSFTDMDRQTCTQCHQQGRAPDNCLTCHNYHVEPLTQSINQISDSLGGGDDE